MRFNSPKIGDTLTENGFLFLPKTIGRETRWFEYVTIKYEFQEGSCDMVYGNTPNRWVAIKFIDEPEAEKPTKHHHYWVWNHIDEAYIFCQDCNVRLDERTGNKGVYNYVDCVDGELIPKKKS